MTAVKPGAIFVKGRVEFSVDHYQAKYKDQEISRYGVNGLSWGDLHPHDHFGRTVIAKITIEDGDKEVVVQTNGTITRETTANDSTMGLKFAPSAEQAQVLGDTIERLGYQPQEYNRKFPRIPSDVKINNFPMQIIGTPAKPHPDRHDPLIIYQVKNLSLGGVLITTENPFSHNVEPGHQLILNFEPRGNFSMHIRVKGEVCRVIEEINPRTMNVTRYLGVKFSEVDQQNRSAFLGLLKEILEQIKQNMSA